MIAAASRSHPHDNSFFQDNRIFLFINRQKRVDRTVIYSGLKKRNSSNISFNYFKML
ncbi:hypothetical protein D1AOALGA4SA_9928 [Olavius algarvensis Delta 1 endosymbiont]|nr:hypothetical protein D1AOALGA4SA_9928 [Olavius algarvensis Delta 1 endosymbiont]